MGLESDAGALPRQTPPRSRALRLTKSDSVNFLTSVLSHEKIYAILLPEKTPEKEAPQAHSLHPAE